MRPRHPPPYCGPSVLDRDPVPKHRGKRGRMHLPLRRMSSARDRTLPRELHGLLRQSARPCPFAVLATGRRIMAPLGTAAGHLRIRRRPNMRSHSRVRRPYPGCTRLYRRSCTAHGRQQLRSCRRTCPTCPGRKNTAELSGPRPSHQINSTSSPSISNQGQLACNPALRRIFHSTTNN